MCAFVTLHCCSHPYVNACVHIERRLYLATTRHELVHVSFVYMYMYGIFFRNCEKLTTTKNTCGVEKFGEGHRWKLRVITRHRCIWQKHWYMHGYKTRRELKRTMFLCFRVFLVVCVFGQIPVQSLYEAKGTAGNIIPAIATTNAIIAGLQVIWWDVRVVVMGMAR